MNRLNKLDVFYHDRRVGTLALYQNRLAAFEYDKGKENSIGHKRVCV